MSLLEGFESEEVAEFVEAVLDPVLGGAGVGPDESGDLEGREGYLGVCECLGDGLGAVLLKGLEGFFVEDVEGLFEEEGEGGLLVAFLVDEPVEAVRKFLPVDDDVYVCRLAEVDEFVSLEAGLEYQIEELAVNLPDASLFCFVDHGALFMT